ncbi:hypothetical protein K440DRAFT_605871 [Wilcoxina mikolae CBS 423.85]|nr:hypothetical protein K440DRAFT_605871 [Wilcoxina mikolae CBS 423.85]
MQDAVRLVGKAVSRVGHGLGTTDDWKFERRVLSHLLACHHHIKNHLYLQTSDVNDNGVFILSAIDIANALYRHAQLKEAEELEIQALNARLRIFGEEHPDTLTSMCNLASTYSSQGRWKEAEELGVQIMETRKRILEHPDTLISMDNLAYTYKSQGRIEEAISMMTETLTLRSRNLGVDHPDTKDSVTALSKWTRELEGTRNDLAPQKYVSSSLVPIGPEFVHQGSGIIGAFQHSVNFQYEQIPSHLQEYSQRVIPAAQFVQYPNFRPFVPTQYTSLHTIHSSFM